MERFWKNKWFVGLVYLLLVLASLYMLLQIKPIMFSVFTFIKAIVTPFFIAVIISYILNPIVNILNQRKVPRTIAVLLIYSVFLSSLTVIIMNMTPMFVSQIAELNEHMPQMAMRAQSLVDGFNQNQLLPDSVRNGFNHSLTKLENSISMAISNYMNQIGNTINMLFIAFIVPFVAFYILKDFQIIEKTALAIVPREHRKKTIKLLIDIDTALGNYIRGQLLVCLIIGALAYLGYWLIGMQYALLLASVVAVFNIIPYLGPFFGAAPAIIMASTISLKMLLLVALVNLAVQILEGNVISPQVVGRTLHMHPLFIIFALLVGGEVAGIVGLILAVPFFAVMKVIIQHIFLHYVHKPTT
ncbi:MULTISPECIES: AI-2E family transporter [unclassified Paenibacillus]|uniref:AI-2E family transporter n=1 Tax=unclassified Paenibacillus TaxID=185978 RepID=UPI002786DB28|nr:MULTISPECIES: AI-2E family transporter [unclassified Paenibacillus]MDQ0901395.1 putative PurR-regulated permease PerM [Paenibacillus sp. V4I7]MDQ0920103.1 putative PurR-regulated permease PerM [Paenibacillus sp. V4I5]